MQADPDQCTIEKGSLKPLAGNTPVLTQETLRNYSVNRFYEPIPLEFLTAVAQNPQVLVTVNGIEAICPKMNCDYTYSDPKALVKTQKLTGNVLEVTGENLPVTADTEVSISGTACTINEKTALKVKCTLAIKPVAGDWHVEVRDSEGRAKTDANLAKISVPLTVSAVSPNKDINFNGGTILTLTGTGFPTEVKKATVTLDD